MAAWNNIFFSIRLR